MGKELLFMLIREELKKEAAREEWKKFIDQVWRRTEEAWTKKREVKLNLILRKLIDSGQMLLKLSEQSK